MKRMEVEKLKFSLLDKLISITDQHVLETVNKLIGNVDLENTMIKVNERQHNMLSSSDEDIIKGNIIGDDQLNEEEDRWLNG
jgi:hypothetical protein